MNANNYTIYKIDVSAILRHQIIKLINILTEIR